MQGTPKTMAAAKKQKGAARNATASANVQCRVLMD